MKNIKNKVKVKYGVRHTGAPGKLSADGVLGAAADSREGVFRCEDALCASG
jgi:hypothetical protein